MQTYLKFTVLVPHATLPGMVQPSEAYFDAAHVASVEEVWEQGTGKRGVAIALVAEGGPYGKPIIMGYAASEIVRAKDEAEFRSVSYAETGAWPEDSDTAANNVVTVLPIAQNPLHS